MRETDRPAAFADRFYPGRPDALEAMVAELTPPHATPTPARGLMLPHAGFVYSGGVAAATVAATTIPRLAVVVGPKHTWSGASMAVNTRGRWRLPGGPLEIDAELGGAIAEALPFLEDDDAAFAAEHSVEVTLPFLRAAQPNLRIVPLVLGARLSPTACVEVGERLAEVTLAWGDDVVFVASSDMHHQGTDDLPPGRTTWDVTRERTARALEPMDADDPAGLVRRCHAERITMCGVQPAAVVMAACSALGGEVQRVAVTDSHAVRPGDGRYTVGYAGYRFGA